MGNCVRCNRFSYSDTSSSWGGDDHWGSPEPEKQFFKKNSERKIRKEEKETAEAVQADEMPLGLGEKKKMKEGGGGGAAAGAGAVKEVKITITRKQLEDLIRNVNVEGRSSVEEILAHLVLVSNTSSQHHYQAHHRSWRPVLQSIPE